MKFIIWRRNKFKKLLKLCFKAIQFQASKYINKSNQIWSLLCINNAHFKTTLKWAKVILQLFINTKNCVIKMKFSIYPLMLESEQMQSFPGGSIVVLWKQMRNACGIKNGSLKDRERISDFVSVNTIGY